MGTTPALRRWGGGGEGTPDLKWRHEKEFFLGGAGGFKFSILFVLVGEGGKKTQ